MVLSSYQISCSMHSTAQGALRLHRTVILIIVHSLLTLWCVQQPGPWSQWSHGPHPVHCLTTLIPTLNELVVVVQLVVNVVREILLCVQFQDCGHPNVRVRTSLSERFTSDNDISNYFMHLLNSIRMRLSQILHWFCNSVCQEIPSLSGKILEIPHPFKTWNSLKHLYKCDLTQLSFSLHY